MAVMRMAKESLVLRASDGTRELVRVSYVAFEHWNTSDKTQKAYDVLVSGKVVGHVESAVASTNRLHGLIRVPGKGRHAWAWRRADGKENGAGRYASTRSNAVAELLGFVSVAR
jgi:hypothetical protein